MKKYIFAAGGTAGHIFMARGIARNIDKNRSQTILITDQRGAIYADDSFDRLCILPISSGKITIFNMRLWIKSCALIWQLLHRKDCVLIGCGAYVSLLAGLIAIVKRVPIYIYQGDQVIGRANSFLQHFAKLSFVSTTKLQNMKRSVVVGIVSREEIIEKTMNSHVFNLLIIGSSLGSPIFDILIPAIMRELKPSLRSRIKIVQQTKVQHLHKTYQELGIQCFLSPFINTIEEIPMANLVICRGGWGTISDLITAKRAAIIIPWSGALDNHQVHNIEVLGPNSSWVFDERVQPKTVAHFIEELISDFFMNPVDSKIERRRQYHDAPRTDAGKVIGQYLNQLDQ